MWLRTSSNQARLYEPQYPVFFSVSVMSSLCCSPGVWSSTNNSPGSHSSTGFPSAPVCALSLVVGRSLLVSVTIHWLE